MTLRPATKRKTAEEVALAYKSEPWWYDVRGFFILTFAYNSTLPEQLRLFGGNMTSPHLELACGTGTLLELVMRWRAWKRLPLVKTIWVDYAESMLAGAQRRFAKNPAMTFEHADAAQLPFPDGTFATINCANALHCMPDLDAALAEVARVLAPGGKFAANVLLFPTGHGVLARIADRINKWGIRKGILHTPYQLADIQERLGKAGLTPTFEQVSGNCYNVIAVRRAS